MESISVVIVNFLSIKSGCGAKHRHSLCTWPHGPSQPTCGLECGTRLPLNLFWTRYRVEQGIVGARHFVVVFEFSVVNFIHYIVDKEVPQI